MNNKEDNKTIEGIIDKASKELKQELEKCNNNLKDLFNEDTFCGPIASHIKESLQIITQATENNINSLNQIVNEISNDLGGIQ